MSPGADADGDSFSLEFFETLSGGILYRNDDIAGKAPRAQRHDLDREISRQGLDRAHVGPNGKIRGPADQSLHSDLARRLRRGVHDQPLLIEKALLHAHHRGCRVDASRIVEADYRFFALRLSDVGREGDQAQYRD